MSIFLSSFLPRHLLVIAALALSVLSPVANADEAQGVEERIKASLKMMLPNLEPDSIRKTEVAGLYEIMFGPRLIYVTEDGRYLIQGSILDLETRENITEPRIAQAKLAAVNALGEDNMLIFGPKDAKHTITVFTDIDCGYCRKLHSEIADYNAEGIRIRYLLYPRAGKGSESYNKAVSSWCADDRKAALTKAKSGIDIEAKTCDNPIDQHMKIGQQMGVRGTPALLLEDGELVPGYIPPKKLAQALNGD